MVIKPKFSGQKRLLSLIWRLLTSDSFSRSSKLELIKNRMQNQTTTFETLKSENEDVDITDVAIQLTSAELTYEAALMATGKVMQTTLLNFI